MLSSTTFLTTVAAPYLFEKEFRLPDIKLYFHVVLETNGADFDDEQSRQFRQFVAGFVRAKGGSVKAVASAQGKVFLLVGLDHTQSLAEFVRELKLVSRTFAQRRLALSGFAFRETYEAFSVSLSQLERVQSYIARQTRLEKQEAYASSWQPLTGSKLY